VSDHEAQEQSGGYIKDTLGRVELPLKLPQVGEGFGEVSDELVFLGGLDEHIVYVSFNISPDLRPQSLIYHLLICCSNIFEAKSHDLIAVDVMGRYECCFVFVVGIQGYPQSRK
jgi:hypothetical protein